MIKNNSTHTEGSAQIAVDEPRYDDHFLCPTLSAIRCTGDGNNETKRSGPCRSCGRQEFYI